jgi:hypothetical protein
MEVPCGDDQNFLSFKYSVFAFTILPPNSSFSYFPFSLFPPTFYLYLLSFIFLFFTFLSFQYKLLTNSKTKFPLIPIMSSTCYVHFSDIISFTPFPFISPHNNLSPQRLSY